MPNGVYPISTKKVTSINGLMMEVTIPGQYVVITDEEKTSHNLRIKNILNTKRLF